jgi:hypothetical protein
MFKNSVKHNKKYCVLKLKNNIAKNLPVKPRSGGIPAIDNKLNIIVYIIKL